MEINVKDNDIIWLGRLDNPTFLGWTVGQNNCTAIEYDETNDAFKVTFTSGDFNVIPAEGFGVGFRPKPNRSKRRAEKAMGIK